MQRHLSLACAAVLLAPAAWAAAAPFTPGDIAVYRTGNGTAAAVGAAVAVFVDEYTPTGTLVQSVALPTVVGTGDTANPLTAAANSTNGGLMTLSGNGQYLALPGYGAAVGTASVSGPNTSRIVGLVDVYTGAINTTTVFGNGTAGTAYNAGTSSTGEIRSAYTVNGTAIYASGTDANSTNGGIYYATAGSNNTATQLSTDSQNTRAIGVAGGQLYASTASGSLRLGTVGSGTPTTSGQTITNLPGFPTGTIAPNQFYFADLSSAVAGVDTLYIADQAGTTRGIRKYSLVSGSWTFNNVIATGTTNFYGLAGVTVNGVVSLYATTAGTNSNTANAASILYGLSDSAGYNAGLNGSLTTIATAATYNAFRGVAVVPEPAGLCLLGGAGVLLLRRRA